VIPLSSKDATVDPRWKGFGDWIADKQRSASPSVSDRELARRAKVSHTTIGQLKRGSTATTPETVIDIARALGATEQEAFVILGMNAYNLTAEEMEFAGLLKDLNLYQKRVLKQTARATREALVTAAN